MVDVCDLISEIESITIRYFLNKSLNKFNLDKEENFRKDITDNIEEINNKLSEIKLILGISPSVMNAIRESINIRNSTENKICKLESYIRQLCIISETSKRSIEEKQEILSCIHNLGLVISSLLHMGYLNQFRCFDKYEENLFKNLNFKRFEEVARIYRTYLNMLQPVIIKYLPDFSP